MRRLLGILLCLLFTAPLFSQTVVIDWVGKNLKSSPAKINRRTEGTIQVQNVNDTLYKYSIQATATPRINDDFSAIAKAFAAAKAAGEAAADDCPGLLATAQTATTDLGDAVTAFYKLPETGTYGGKACSLQSPCSINLKDTRDHWKAVSTKIDTAAAAGNALKAKTVCKNRYGKEAADLDTALANARDKGSYIVTEQHNISTTLTLEPDFDYTVEVKELYQGALSSGGIPTNADVVSVKFSPANDRLTLSAGVLASRIPNLSYSSQPQPNSDNTGTQNVLAVAGQSTFSPLAVALLNYELPPISKAYFSNDNYGLALSTGPTIRFGTKSDTSSFGYFFGLSLHLYHRLYLTPGLHFGEFADYPPGFTHAGQAIPTGLGTPMPTKRYTLRFAFGVTYKAKDFSGLGLTASATAKPADDAAGAAKPKANASGGTNVAPVGGKQ